MYGARYVAHFCLLPPVRIKLDGILLHHKYESFRKLYQVREASLTKPIVLSFEFESEWIFFCGRNIFYFWF